MRLLIACVALALGSVSLNAYSVAEIDDSFLAELQAAESADVFRGFIHFHGGDAAARKQIIADAGLQFGKDYGSFTPARFAMGSAAGFLSLTTHPAVRYVEQDVQLRYFGETAAWASRARVAQGYVR